MRLRVFFFFQSCFSALFANTTTYQDLSNVRMLVMPARIFVLWHTHAKLEFLTTLNNCSRLKWQPCSAKCTVLHSVSQPVVCRPGWGCWQILYMVWSNAATSWRTFYVICSRLSQHTGCMCLLNPQYLLQITVKEMLKFSFFLLFPF